MGFEWSRAILNKVKFTLNTLNNCVNNFEVGQQFDGTAHCTLRALSFCPPSCSSSWPTTGFPSQLHLPMLALENLIKNLLSLQWQSTRTQGQAASATKGKLPQGRAEWGSCQLAKWNRTVSATNYHNDSHSQSTPGSCSLKQKLMICKWLYKQMKIRLKADVTWCAKSLYTL